MNFGTAIKTCFNKYADFGGRASRSEYFFFFLFVALTYVAVYFVSMSIFINTTLSDGVVKFLFSVPSIWALAITIPLCAACARRLHDVNRSGWWQLIELTIIGILLILVWNVTEGEKKKNIYGPPIKIKS